MGRGLTWQREQREQQQQQRPQQRPAAERRHSAGRGWHAPPAAPHTGQRPRGGDWGRTERPRRARPGPTLCISSPLAFGEKRGEGQGRPEEGGREGRRWTGRAAGRGSRGQCPERGGGGAGQLRTRGAAGSGAIWAERGPADAAPPGQLRTRRQLRPSPSRAGAAGCGAWRAGWAFQPPLELPAMPTPGTPGSPGTAHGSPAWRASATCVLEPERRYRRAVPNPELPAPGTEPAEVLSSGLCTARRRCSTVQVCQSILTPTGPSHACRRMFHLRMGIDLK